MNQPILDWIGRIKDDYPKLFWRNRVIEFGALDVNGSAKIHFDEPLDYIGVDAQDGNGVDVKALTHQYPNDEKFDVVVSTEMLEHDPYWDLSLKNMFDLVNFGGSIILTWAGPARHQHGADRYTPLNHYYRNISMADAFRIVSRYQFRRIVLDNKDNSFLNLFCYYKF